MKNKMLIFVLAFIFAVFSVALGRQMKHSNEEKTIYLINKSKYGYENTAIVNGAKSAAKEYGVDLQVLAPDSEMDLKAQKLLIEEAYSNRPYGIIICPIETVEITNKLAEIDKPEVKIVLINNEPSLSGGFERIGFDNREMGVEIARRTWSADRVSKVNVYSSSEGVGETNSIINGMKKLYGEDVELEIYKDMPTAKHLYKSILNKHLEDGIDVALCLDEPSLLGLADCKGILGESPIVGINNSMDIIRNIDNGNIDEIYVLNYFEYGYEGLVKIIGKFDKDKYKNELLVVDKDNLFDEDIEKLIFPLN